MRLRSISVLALLVIFIFAGCKKEEEITTLATTQQQVGAPPATFTQKIVIEKFTGEWCVNCPDGSVVLEEVLAEHPNVSMAAEIHWDDWLEMEQYTNLNGFLGQILVFPSAAINRVHAKNTSNPVQDGFLVYTRNNWPEAATRLLKDKAVVGLALSTKFNAGKLDIKVYASANTELKKETHLTVYLLEDNVPSKKQIGADSNYKHQHVVRKVISDGLGDPITFTKLNSPVVKEYKGIDFSGYNPANLKILAFVTEVPTSTDNVRKILNGQQVKAGQTKNWD